MINLTVNDCKVNIFRPYDQIFDNLDNKISK